MDLSVLTTFFSLILALSIAAERMVEIVCRVTPPEALRRSQLKIMHNLRTAAPYYWAGFIVTSTML